MQMWILCLLSADGADVWWWVIHTSSDVGERKKHSFDSGEVMDCSIDPELMHHSTK
jgi:hypothetical protein